jgi:hypothetical protein
MNRPVSFRPCSYTRSNSGRRRTRSCRERRSVTGRWLVLPLVRDGETFPTSGPAALQHDTAVLCRHPHAKAVCLATAARIGLKRALPLCHLDCVLHELSVETSSRQTPNTSRRSDDTVKNGVDRCRCVTVRGRRVRCSVVRRPLQSIRFLPQDFHTCGKHCGKTNETVELPPETPYFFGFLARRRPADAVFSGFRQQSQAICEALTPFTRRKSVFS